MVVQMHLTPEIRVGVGGLASDNDSQDGSIKLDGRGEAVDIVEGQRR